ncbi:hypothetical protein [Cytobacillus firmus]|uniref:hypothetical protein n=1 Tax=Cytobacillus firmus TaxID=1399 RepID=UPI001F55644C|nr:hypothetical protein [Cytobacillus firmus]
MIQLQEDKENSKKNNEEEDSGWDVGENMYEAGEQLADEGCLGCAGDVFSGFISCVDTTLYFSDIEFEKHYQWRCLHIFHVFVKIDLSKNY